MILKTNGHAFAERKTSGETIDGTAHQSSECSSGMIAHLLICSASNELSMGRVFIWQLPAMVPSILTIAAPIYSWREPICDAQAGKGHARCAHPRLAWIYWRAWADKIMGDAHPRMAWIYGCADRMQ
ncbi:TPA: hypothetical protein UM684_001867 [Stenotrophomonas maltophilia]|uniref:hypothetical protein n=1 Tax=Stenotrophomonas maltophilia TaxID=40324 RepID=UPI0014639408|nr:hypothetical protein [Stenotrophomonas maltophilia]MBH1382031.1 hypothetical protein [Stenotrophomonas maltophilia]MBH1398149.1 hypothetical protein [Stenotrophomonas maltophilia]MBH1471049.1 hypothetical protein [Stenotrophomonas maltophilia]MBH1474995.1 hypothetical protein [Stenotrophomonas maltophilia]QJP20913.1 hypothetical protein HKK60_15670 [Stenotrophomonas maltophilia]